MAKSLYEKSTRENIKEMLADWGLGPGEVFSAGDALQWFAKHYPLLKEGTIRAHLAVFSTNDRSRLYHAMQEGDDVLFKVANAKYRLYAPQTDPAPIRKMEQGDVAPTQVRAGTHLEEEDDEDLVDEAPAAQPGSSNFALEQDLQRYLSRNLHIVEPGLTLFDDDGIDGFEYPAGNGRRIDILAIDKAGTFVVLELKVDKGYERVGGQLLRYMNWVRRNLSGGKPVRGIVVCRTMSPDLRLVFDGMPNVDLFEYQLSVTVSKVPRLDPV